MWPQLHGAEPAFVFRGRYEGDAKRVGVVRCKSFSAFERFAAMYGDARFECTCFWQSVASTGIYALGSIYFDCRNGCDAVKVTLNIALPFDCVRLPLETYKAAVVFVCCISSAWHCCSSWRRLYDCDAIAFTAFSSALYYDLRKVF